MKSSPSDAEPDELYGELANLRALGPERLKERWRILYGTEPPPRISEDLLRRAIAYRLQERACGGLKPFTRRLLQRIARDARPRSSSATTTRKLSAGAVLIREWQGTCVWRIADFRHKSLIRHPQVHQGCRVPTRKSTKP